MKTGTVEIQQHVETTPTVSKSMPIGTILVEEWQIPDMIRSKGHSGSFIVLGRKSAYKFIGTDYLTICNVTDYTASSTLKVLEDEEILSYLRVRAQKLLGGVIFEIEEGVFDD